MTATSSGSWMSGLAKLVLKKSAHEGLKAAAKASGSAAFKAATHSSVVGMACGLAVELGELGVKAAQGKLSGEQAAAQLGKCALKGGTMLAGAEAGAALGTLVMPGVGTVVGGALGSLLAAGVTSRFTRDD